MGSINALGVCYFGFSLDLCVDTRLSLKSVSGQQAAGRWSCPHHNPSSECPVCARPRGDNLKVTV